MSLLKELVEFIEAIDLKHQDNKAVVAALSSLCNTLKIQNEAEIHVLVIRDLNKLPSLLNNKIVMKNIDAEVLAIKFTLQGMQPTEVGSVAADLLSCLPKPPQVSADLNRALTALAKAQADEKVSLEQAAAAKAAVSQVNIANAWSALLPGGMAVKESKLDLFGDDFKELVNPFKEEFRKRWSDLDAQCKYYRVLYPVDDSKSETATWMSAQVSSLEKALIEAEKIWFKKNVSEKDLNDELQKLNVIYARLQKEISSPNNKAAIKEAVGAMFQAAMPVGAIHIAEIVKLKTTVESLLSGSLPVQRALEAVSRVIASQPAPMEADAYEVYMALRQKLEVYVQARLPEGVQTRGSRMGSEAGVHYRRSSSIASAAAAAAATPAGEAGLLRRFSKVFSREPANSVSGGPNKGAAAAPAKAAAAPLSANTKK
jgi:hypothetical protein